MWYVRRVPAGKAEDAERRAQYQGVSLRVRQAQRRAALLEVTIELIAEEGPHVVTVRRVCEAARLNQRYFYESFANRGELLAGAFEVVRTEALDVLSAALDRTRDEDRAFAARVVAEAYIHLLVDPPHRGRVLLIDPEVEPALRASREQLFLALAEHLTRDIRGTLGIDQQHAKRLQLRVILVGAGINEVIRSWQSGRLALDRDELGDYIAEAFVALAALP